MPTRFVIVLLTLASSVQAATVVVNDNLVWSAIEEVPFDGSNHYAALTQSIGGSYTGTWFRYDGDTIAVTSYNIDEASDWYVVDKGEIFSESITESVTARRLNDIYSSSTFGGPVVIGASEDVYLGMKTDENGFEEGPRNAYGWVRLRPRFVFTVDEVGGIPLEIFLDAGWFDFLTPEEQAEISRYELEYVESAIAYDSRGIIVGTTTVVPEPSTLLLFMGCGLLLPLSRRR